MDKDAGLILSGVASFLFFVLATAFKKIFDKSDDALKVAIEAKSGVASLKEEHEKRDNEINRRLKGIDENLKKVDSVEISMARLEANSQNMSRVMEKMEAHLLRIEQNQNAYSD